MDYDGPLCPSASAGAVIVDQVCYPDLAVAVDRDIVIRIRPVRRANKDSLFRLPRYASCCVQCSEAELHVSAAARVIACLVVTNIEHCGAVRMYAEVIVSDVNRYLRRGGPVGTVGRGCVEHAARLVLASGSRVFVEEPDQTLGVEAGLEIG